MSRAEWRWVLVASLAVLLLASLPTLYAWSLSDADHVFTGFCYNVEDGHSYLAKMRLGAEGEWLFHLFYTPEDHSGAFVYPFYLLLGKLARLAGLSLPLTYHLARAGLGLFLLLTIYAFAARLTADVTLRRLAWALTALGSGMGWLLVLGRLVQWLGAMPLDFWVPEAFVFLVLYSLPHLALAEALLLWSLLWTLDSFEEKRLWPAIKAGLAAIGMVLVVPFYAGVLAAVLGAYLVALFLALHPAAKRSGLVQPRGPDGAEPPARWRIPWRQIGLAAIVGACVAPIVAYNSWVFGTNPVFKQWIAQNTILSPHPVHYVLGYLPLLLPAIPGAIAVVRNRKAERLWLLPLAWVVIVPLLLYAPFNLQRRMIAGAQVPLALLAARGLLTVARGGIGARSTPLRYGMQSLQPGHPGRGRLAIVAWVALAALSNLILVGGSLVEVQARAMPAFRPGGEIAAADWLDQHASLGDIVLTTYRSGNLLPVLAGVRVFIGHGPETLYHDEKLAELQQFYDPATGDDWRQAFLARYGVDYVFWGPDERALGTWSPAAAPYLLPVYDQQSYAIYQVEAEEK